MPIKLLLTVTAPILALFIINLGNGLLSSLTTLRLDTAGQPEMIVGIVTSAYFIGLTLGALFNDRLIVRIGHIRAYSGFASLIAVTVLLQGMYFDPWAWLSLRLINGWATVGLFLVVESWLLLATDRKMRGRVLAVYMIAFYGSGMLSQVKLGAIDAWGEAAPFMAAGMLASLSVLPMVIIPKTAPLVERVVPLQPYRLFRMTPTGVIGCFGSGITIAAIYALLPLYLQRIGLDVEQVGWMMASAILGAMLLQYPVGLWSDRRDRQVVMIVLAAFCTLLSAAVLILPLSLPLLASLLFLLGGGIFAVYPVAISHSTDNAPAEALVPMIQGLLLINSFGSAISPLIISPVMAEAGESGFFWALGVLNLCLVVFFIWRRRVNPGTPSSPFAPTTQMSPLGAELRITEAMVQSAADDDRMGGVSGESQKAPSQET